MMRLTAESDPQTIRRYDHVRPGRGFGVRRCGASCTGIERACTRARGHAGPHVAHGGLGRVLAVWDADADLRARPEARRRMVEAARPGGLPSRRSDSVFTALRRSIADRVGSVEDLAMLLFLLAFLGFAVDWFLRMLG